MELTNEFRVGVPIDHAYVVESGLRSGERVVVEGQQNILPGTRVNVAELRAEAASAGERPDAAYDMHFDAGTDG